MRWEGEGNEKQSPGKTFTASEINRLNSKAKRKYPQSNLGNKSMERAEDGLGTGGRGVERQQAQAQGVSE